MFEGLDDVNWRKLHHAYGSAENIPGLLRAFASAKDEQAYEELYDDLLNMINHQGDIYSATAATVPFLIQMLLNKNFSKRDWILHTLFFLEQTCDSHAKSSQSIVVLEDVFATFSSIKHGVPVYMSLLRDSNGDIRALAAYLIVCVNGRQRGARLRIWKAAQREENPFVHALMIFCTGCLVQLGLSHYSKIAREKYHERFVDLIASSVNPIIQIAAASAWMESVFWSEFSPLPTLIPHTVGGAIATQIQKGIPDQFTLFKGLFVDDDNIRRHARVGRCQGLAESLSVECMPANAVHIIIRE